MRCFRHIIPLALAAMVSLPAGASDLYKWVEVKDQKLPDAPLVVNNVQTTLAAYKGKVVLLNFWATWCGPCRKEMPTLDELEIIDGKKGLVVIPVDIERNLSYADLRDFATKAGLMMPHIAQDPTGQFSHALVNDGLPVTYLIDRQGKLRYTFEGAVNWLLPEQKEKVESLLAEGERR